MATAKSETQWTNVGRGVAYAVVDGHLVTRVPITPEAIATAKVSASGKSRVLGSTEGNVKIAGTDVVLGLNVYTKNITG